MWTGKGRKRVVMTMIWERKMRESQGREGRTASLRQERVWSWAWMGDRVGVWSSWSYLGRVPGRAAGGLEAQRDPHPPHPVTVDLLDPRC